MEEGRMEEREDGETIKTEKGKKERIKSPFPPLLPFLPFLLSSYLATQVRVFKSSVPWRFTASSRFAPFRDCSDNG